MERYVDFLLAAVIAWTLAGLMALVLIAAATGPNSAWTTAAAIIIFTPFGITIISMMIIAWGQILRDELRHARRGGEGQRS